MQFSLRIKRIIYVLKEYFMLCMYKNKIIFNKQKIIFNERLNFLLTISKLFFSQSWS